MMRRVKVKDTRRRGIVVLGMLASGMVAMLGLSYLMANNYLSDSSSQAQADTGVSSSSVANDTFQRPNQTFWGTASDGHAWGAAVTSNKEFTIANNAGQEYNASGNTWIGTLGPQLTDAEVLVTFKSSTYSSSNVGAILRETDSNNYYVAYLDGTNLVVKKKVSGSISTLTTSAFTAQANTYYNLRFRVLGNNLYAKAWASSSSEPSSWNITINDSSLLVAGNMGIRTTEQSGATITYTSFQGYQLLQSATSTPTPTLTLTPTQSPTPTDNSTGLTPIPTDTSQDNSTDNNGNPIDYSSGTGSDQNNFDNSPSDNGQNNFDGGQNNFSPDQSSNQNQNSDQSNQPSQTGSATNNHISDPSLIIQSGNQPSGKNVANGALNPAGKNPVKNYNVLDSAKSLYNFLQGLNYSLLNFLSGVIKNGTQTIIKQN